MQHERSLKTERQKKRELNFPIRKYAVKAWDGITWYVHAVRLRNTALCATEKRSLRVPSSHHCLPCLPSTATPVSCYFVLSILTILLHNSSLLSLLITYIPHHTIWNMVSRPSVVPPNHSFEAHLWGARSARVVFNNCPCNRARARRALLPVLYLHVAFGPSRVIRKF